MPSRGSGAAKRVEQAPLYLWEMFDVGEPGPSREASGRRSRRELPEVSSQSAPTDITQKVAQVGSRTTLKMGPFPDDGGDRYDKRKREGAMWSQVRKKLANGIDWCRFCFAITPEGVSIMHEPAQCRMWRWGYRNGRVPSS